jgi:phosphoenolpyruvate carboxykinase (GTP)
MCERVDGKVGAQETPIGLLPDEGDIDLSGLDISPDEMKELMSIDTDAWKADIPDIENHFAKFGDCMPERLRKQLEEFVKRLG